MSNAWLASTQRLQFALEDVLARDGQVFFESIFSTRHLGRVIDLMLFQCREFILHSAEPAQAEYRFRQMIELAAFNGWTNYRAGEQAKCVDIELGWDEQKLVIAVSHYVDDGLAGFVPGSGVKPTSKTAARMLKMLVQIQALADGLIVRHDTKTGRVQLIAFLASGATERSESPQYVDLAALPAASAAPEPAEAPVELSNADIDAFANDEAGDGPPPGATAPQSPEPETRFAADAPEPEARTVVSGGKVEGPDNTKQVIKGSKEEKVEDIRIKGERENLGGDRTKMVVRGGEGPQRLPLISNKKEQLLLEQIRNLNSQIETLKEELASSPRTVSSPKTAPSSEAAAPAAGPSRRELQLEAQIKNLNSQIELMRKDQASGKRVVSPSEPAAEKAATGADAAAARREEHLQEKISRLNEQVEKLRAENRGLQESVHAAGKATTEAVNKALADAEARAATEEDEKSEVEKYKQELDAGKVDASAQAWAKGLMEAVVKERAELKHRTREIDGLLRKREHEFRANENRLSEQARLAEAQLKQRDGALEKSKETIATLSATLDKLRTSNNDAQDKAELAHKLATTEKLLAAANEISDRNLKRMDEVQKKATEEGSLRALMQQENSKLKRQIEELQRKLADMSESSQKGNTMEIANLTDARDKALRQVEELKRQIKELQTKLAGAAASNKGSKDSKDTAKGANTQSEAELRHKITLAENLAKAKADELEKTKKRFDELKQSENKLKAEISRLQGELSKAQSEVKAAGMRQAGATPLSQNQPAPTGKPAAKPGAKK